MKKLIIIALVFLCQNSLSNENIIKNVEAKYIFYYKNMEAGKMTLKINTENNKIKISTVYDGNFLAELANRGYREEISHVEINQNIILPKKYMYKDGEESYQAIFNANKVEIIKKNTEPINLNTDEIIYDPISLLLLLMRTYPNFDTKYNVLIKKNIKIYNYNFKENASIKINKLQYHGYSAEYISGNKKNIFFFSKEHKNLMVSTRIMKKGKEKIRIDLSEIKFLN